jgi:hypothetical protein
MAYQVAGSAGQRPTIIRIANPEVALDAVRIADAELNVVLLPKSSVRVKRLAFPKRPANTVEG